MSVGCKFGREFHYGAQIEVCGILSIVSKHIYGMQEIESLFLESG
jgi:hypothetical protein